MSLLRASLLACAIWCQGAQAQTPLVMLSGRVVIQSDAGSLPVVGARVRVLSDFKSSYERVAKDGYFQLLLPIGAYYLQAAVSGYCQVKPVRVLLVSQTEKVSPTITLTPCPKKTEECVAAPGTLMAKSEVYTAFPLVGKFAVRICSDGVISGELYIGSEVTALAFDPRGNTLAFGRADGYFGVADARVAKVLNTLSFGDVAIALAFSEDARFLAAGSESGKVSVWELAKTKQVVLTTAKGGIKALSFSPDGKYLVISTDGGSSFLRLPSPPSLK